MAQGVKRDDQYTGVNDHTRRRQGGLFRQGYGRDIFHRREWARLRL
jgi:hypothetical protein